MENNQIICQKTEIKLTKKPLIIAERIEDELEITIDENITIEELEVTIFELITHLRDMCLTAAVGENLKQKGLENDH